MDTRNIQRQWGHFDVKHGLTAGSFFSSFPRLFFEIGRKSGKVGLCSGEIKEVRELPKRAWTELAAVIERERDRNCLMVTLFYRNRSGSVSQQLHEMTNGQSAPSPSLVEETRKHLLNPGGLSIITLR